MSQTALLKVARELQLMTAMSQDPAGVLRGLVHNILVEQGAVAAFLGILLDDSSFLVLESYGYHNNQVLRGDLHSIWNHTAINESLRSGHIRVYRSRDEYLSRYPHNSELELPGDGYVAIPIWQKGAPFCALGISFETASCSTSIQDQETIWELLRLFFEIQNDRPVWLEHMERNWESVKQHLLDNANSISPIALMMNQSDRLTLRQVHVLEGMSQDLTNREIANRLHVSESTIGKESIRIFKELHARNRKHAVAIASKIGLLAAEYLENQVIDIAG